MDFFADESGSLYPISRIKRVTCERGSDGRSKVFWAYVDEDELPVRLGPREYQNLREQHAPYIPAEPGHFVVHLDFSEGNDPVLRVPIIGWCICPDRGPRPITLDGINDGLENDPPVLFPSGHVQTANGPTYDSLDQFIEDNSPSKPA